MSVAFDRVTKRFDNGTVAVADFDLETPEGGFVVLVGPSGCGKTTLLRLLAGLESPTSGRLRIGGRDVTDLPPRARNVAMVFQNYALYPHLDVRGNLAFPLRMARLDKAGIERRVNETAALLDLSELLARKPAQLSGGQRQRVAMGRALVREPDVFCMDEPLSNLDAKLRVRMRAEIVALQRRLSVTTLYVTHDQTEAMTMGDLICVLDHGRLQQAGDARTLYERPANRFVATFIGTPAMNVVAADAWPLPKPPGAAEVGVRPEALVPAATVPAEHRLDVEVVAVEPLGHECHARLRHEKLGELVARLPSDWRVHPGERTEIGVATKGLHAFAADGQTL